MHTEESSENRRLVPFTTQSLLNKRSSVISRGLRLSDDLRLEHAQPYFNRGYALLIGLNIDDYKYKAGKRLTLLNEIAILEGTVRDYEEAVKCFSRSIEIYPRYVKAYSNRGFAHAFAGDKEKAIQDWVRALELGYQEAEENRKRELVYNDLKGQYGIIRDWSRELDLATQYKPNFNDAQTFYFYGSMISWGLYSGTYREAIHQFTRAIYIEPRYARAYINRGNQYKISEDFRKAFEDFTKAIEINHQSIIAYNNRGEISVYSGDLQKAIEDFTQALMLDPQYETAKNNLLSIAGK